MTTCYPKQVSRALPHSVFHHSVGRWDNKLLSVAGVADNLAVVTFAVEYLVVHLRFIAELVVS